MRIFLCGASGTGKTTVGKMLASYFDIPHMPSVSRESPYEQGTPEHQEFVRKGIVKSANEEGVHDRTILDVLAYNSIMGIDRRQVLLDVSSWTYTEPVVIYFPIFFDAEDDGVRPINMELNRAVDSWIKAGLDIFVGKGRYFSISSGTPEERTESVITYLKEHHG